MMKKGRKEASAREKTWKINGGITRKSTIKKKKIFRGGGKKCNER